MEANIEFEAAREALDKELSRVAPVARQVPLFWLRRIIRRHRQMPASAGPAPHENDYYISRDDLESVVDPHEIGLQQPLPDHILLLPELDEDELRNRPYDWHHRIEAALFHYMLDLRFEERFPDFESTRVLWSIIGRSQREEIRLVLNEQGRIFPEDDYYTQVEETVGLFLELWYFDRERMDDFFPGMSNIAELAKIFEEKLDSAPLAEACRLRLNEPKKKPAAPEIQRPNFTHSERSKLQLQAAKSATQGNLVRAMLIQEKLGETAEANAIQQQFLTRLNKALPHEKEIDLTSICTSLRQQGISSEVPLEARLLFDLQNVCIDVEQPIFAVDVMESVLTLGRKPIKRELADTREIRLIRHLRSALKHSEEISDFDSSLIPLSQFLSEIIHDLEHAVREKIRPILHSSLEEVGLVATNLPEKISRDKLVEEMLDAIVERGFLRMGDVRDAIARNQLKLQDVSGFKEFLRGDALLRLNWLLPYKLDGIYQRGEIYLRIFQRASSVFFGTIKGRIVTKYLIMPFGGAFLFLEGIHHFWDAIDGFARFFVNNPRPEHVVDGAMKSVTQLLPLRKALGSVGRYTPEEPTWATLPAVVMLGIFLLGMFYIPNFRRAVFQGITNLLYRWPRAIFEAPIVQRVLHNPITRWIRKYLLVPTVSGLFAAVLARLLGEEAWSCAGLGCMVAFMTSIFFRTRTGRELEEQIDEFIGYFWHRFTLGTIIGIFEAIFYFFKNVLEHIERGIYLVDETLRFREGQSRVVYYLKMVAGIFWFFLTYVFRFCWNLLIEPQINPIKHFPVVTVSHKLLLPLIPNIADSFGVSIQTTTTVIFGVPGIFGFLAWELKENWKLYRSNASPTLDPVVIGSHGEKMRRLLRPGFHSGTIPKMFAKLRNSPTTGRIRKFHKQLHHIEESLHHLMDRLILPYLKASQRWGEAGKPVPEAIIWIATNRIGFGLYLPEVAPGDPLELMIEDREGCLVASVIQPGWLLKIPENSQSAFFDVLSAAMKFEGVAAFKPHTAWQVGCRAEQIEITSDGLVIQQKDGSTTPITLPQAYIENCPLSWADWVRQWERDQRGDTPIPPLLIRREMFN